MKYADAVVILSLTFRRASDRPSQAPLILSAFLSTKKEQRLTGAVEALPGAPAWSCLKCNKGCQLQLMDLNTRREGANYHVIYCTHFNAALAKLPIL